MNLLFVVLIVTGVLVVRIMPVDVYPDVELDEATIDTFWPGASAEDVERLITDRIEAKLEDIRGVSRIISDSKSDVSLIRVKFHEDQSALELESAFRQMRAAVEQVSDLPPDAERPIVTKISVAEIFPLLWVVVRDEGGQLGEEAVHAAALRLKTVLRDLPGVAKVGDKVLRNREVHVLVDHDRLRQFDLTLMEVAAVLEQYNRDVPSGTLPHARGEFTVRAVGQVSAPEQLGVIAIRKDPRGGHVYLRDVATIREGFERRTHFARFNGQDCKGLSITKERDADGRRVADRVYACIEAFEATLPEGLAVDSCADSSQIIRSRMHILTTNLLTGIVLVFALLWFVMGVRNSLLAVIGIPFSFLCALMLVHWLGVSINAVSLFALVLCSGMIVDDAIVVLENIYRHIEMGKARSLTVGSRNGGDGGKDGLRAAIIDGTSEVMWPVIASSATTVAAFLPMLLMAGVTGKFFAIIPKTVLVVLLASLFECLLMLPVHYLTFGPRAKSRTLLSRLASRKSGGSASGAGVLGGMVGLYDRVLCGVLRHRYTAPLPLLGLGFLTWCAVPLLRVEMFPSDFQSCMVDIKAWDEASLEQTGAVTAPIEQLVLAQGPTLVKSVLSLYGVQITDDNTAVWRNNIAQLHVQLASTRQVAADPVEVANHLRIQIQRYVEAHPDCGVQSFKVWAPQDGPPIGKPVAIRIECPDFAEGKMLAERYKLRLADLRGVYGIVDNLDFGPRQINLRLKEELASVHGLSQPSLSSVLRTANDGAVVSTFKDTQSGENLDVRVMLAEPFRRTIRDLLETEVRCPGGYVLPLRSICDVEMSQGYAGIPHFDGKRVITVTAEVDTNQTTAQLVNEALKREFGDVEAVHPNVRVSYGGEYDETQASFNSLKQA
ncbi:MAG: efflux RND transporter permease subunit, partial [Planctomycetes bacterium]|nr:efflux RND transporter permease subunit [Planctomycetota bacterium]